MKYRWCNSLTGQIETTLIKVLINDYLLYRYWFKHKDFKSIKEYSKYRWEYNRKGW